MLQLNKYFILLPTIALISGCESLPSLPTMSEQITVNSIPQGANIMVKNEVIGSTPLNITPGDYFPAHWKGMSYLVEGHMNFYKPGCNKHKIAVNDPVLSKNITVKLKCDPAYKKPVAKVKPPQPQLPSTNTMHNNDNNAESRLDRLKALLDKGKISKAEYMTIRQRILDSL